MAIHDAGTSHEGGDLPPTGSPRSAVDTVRAYYEERGESEWHRLDNPYEGAVEHEIHARAFEALLPPTGRILDLGGGPGKWTIWLARRGYRVVLADLSPGLLDIARRELALAGVEAEAVIELDARDLGRFRDGEFDAVLALGPLYHLVEASDRDRVVTECARVLRPGGTLLATVMTRYTWLLGMALEWGSARFEAIQEAMRTGIYRNPDPGRFTEAYLFRAAEVAPFFEHRGFRTEKVLASQGFLYLVQEDLAELRARDEAAYDQLLDAAYAAADDPSIHGLTGHLLYAGSRPD